MTGTSLLARLPRLRFAGAAALVAAALSAGCHRAAEKPQVKPAAVLVTEPITADVTDYQDFTGRLEAFLSVDVRARVSGYITEAPFKEGDTVQEGQLLFQIDDRPYKAQLASAEAKVKAAEAQIGVSRANLENAQQTLARAKQAGRAATGLELDQARAQEQANEASLNLARANLGTAKADRDTADLNFKWTKVKSPLTGRISRRNVDPGNLVNADNTVLTTVVQDKDMYLYFDVDERTYLGLVGTTSSAQAKASWLFGLKYPVMMRLATEDDYTHTGTINFLDNRLNGNSGTIRMRGLFANPHGSFKSGLFARVRLPIGAPYKAVLVPDEAVQSDQGRKFVWVVEQRKTKQKNPKTGVEEEALADVARRHYIVPGQAIKGLQVVKKGDQTRTQEVMLRVVKPNRKEDEKPNPKEAEEPALKAGERVIVTGTQRVREGSPVEAGKGPELRAVESPLTKMVAEYRPIPDADRRSAAGEKGRPTGPAPKKDADHGDATGGM